MASPGSISRMKKPKKPGAALALLVLIFLPAGVLTGSLQICLQKKTPTFIFENSLGVEALCPAENPSKEPWVLQAEQEINLPSVFSFPCRAQLQVGALLNNANYLCLPLLTPTFGS